MKNRKRCIKKWEKNRKINSTFVDRSSASTFAGFTSTFQLRRSENNQQRLVYWYSYAVIRMICLTTGRAWFNNQR